MKHWATRSVVFLLALFAGIWFGAITIDWLIPFPNTAAHSDQHEQNEITFPFDDRSHPYALLLMVQEGWIGFGACEYDERIRGSWLALANAKDGSFIQKRTVRLGKPERDDFGQYYAAKLDGEDAVEFLVSDSGRLKEGPAVSLILAGYPEGRLLDVDPISIHFLGQTYNISEIWVSDNNGRQTEILRLEEGGKSQNLFYFEDSIYGEAVSPVFGSSLEWAGDIDNDGRLDFIVNNGDQNGGGEARILFISSIAKQGEMVRAYAYVHTRNKGC